MPLISVIIPTCHRNDLLAKCLDCLAPGVQTLLPEQYEVIVTDDGSRTTAQQLVQNSYPWAQWRQGPRRGPAANRNNGARAAQGEWLAFTDDDCLPQLNWLAAFEGAIRPDLAVYEGRTTCQAGVRSPLQQAPVNLTGGWLWSCNMMIQKRLFERLNGFEETFPHPHMEDVDLRERLKKDSQILLFVGAATVDHPPRPVLWGRKRGATLEGEVMHWYRSGNRTPYGHLLIFRTLRFRLHDLRHTPLSRDSFRAIVSLFLEIGFVIQHVRSWDHKYRTRFCAADAQTMGVR